MFGTVVHYVLRQHRSQTGDIGQEVLAGGIDIHTHVVHHALHGLLQALTQLGLIHIVLVLSHTDGLWFNLHQLRKRVNQPSSDAHRAAYGHVLIGKLLPCNLAGTIYRSPCFTHHKDLRSDF